VPGSYLARTVKLITSRSSIPRAYGGPGSAHCTAISFERGLSIRPGPDGQIPRFGVSPDVGCCRTASIALRWGPADNWFASSTETARASSRPLRTYVNRPSSGSVGTGRRATGGPWPVTGTNTVVISGDKLRLGAGAGP